jgi:tetratricopeptide (TPR) repeat protein
VARENPTGPFAETALFLAGQAAMKTINKGAVDRALDFFDQVVKRHGPLELFARQQQALVQTQLGKEKEAIALYELILAAEPPAEPELRYASFCGKGDNLRSLGAKNPKQLEAAIATFEQLATFPHVPAVWRNQALYKKASVLEQLGRTGDALVAFYDVLEPKEEEREFFWFYKAGFDAARIFEGQQLWRSAIGIYEKMAKAEGPRSAEASARMKKLRLQHFIWN